MVNPELNLANIRSRPAFIDGMPGLSPTSATAIYPYIYVGKALYANLISEQPDPSNVALILHEQEHIKRIREAGILKWYGRYAISRTFRLQEELAAIEPQFAHLKGYGISVDFKHRARILSGGMYLWPGDYEGVYGRLTEIWECANMPKSE